MALNTQNIDFGGGRDLAIEIIRDSYGVNSLVNRGIRRIQSIKSKGYWHDLKLDLTVNCELSDCPDFNTNATLVQNVVDICEYEVSGRVSHQALIGTYRELFLDRGVLNENSFQDTSLAQAMVAMLSESIAEAQNGFLLGGAAGDYFAPCGCPGLVDLILDPTLSRPVPAAQLISSPVLNITNLKDQLDAVIAAMPPKFRRTGRRNDRPEIWTTHKVVDLFEQVLIDPAQAQLLNGMGGFSPTDGTWIYRNYSIVPIDDLDRIDENAIIFTPPSNVGLVEDSEFDATNLLIRNGLDDSSLCKELRYLLAWRQATMFGDGEQIVYSSINN